MTFNLTPAQLSRIDKACKRCDDLAPWLLRARNAGIPMQDVEEALADAKGALEALRREFGPTGDVQAALDRQSQANGRV